MRFVGCAIRNVQERRTILTDISTINKYTLEPFLECIGVRNVIRSGGRLFQAAGPK